MVISCLWRRFHPFPPIIGHLWMPSAGFPPTQPSWIYWVWSGPSPPNLKLILFVLHRGISIGIVQPRNITIISTPPPPHHDVALGSPPWPCHQSTCMHPDTLMFLNSSSSEVALCPLLLWYCVKWSWNVWFRDYQYVFYLEKVIFHLGKVYFILISPSM